MDQTASNSAQSKSRAICPERPELTLRVGFAGNRKLSDDAERRAWEGLRKVLGALQEHLAAIGTPVGSKDDASIRVADFYDRDAPPTLRLVTGLCEGADWIAAETLRRLATDGDDTGAKVRCQTELAAVLPFPVADYRAGREESFRPEFDKQLERCSWVLELDGIYDKPTDEQLAHLGEKQRKDRKSLASNRRSRGYRAQGSFLLRQSDLLIAAADPTEEGRAGGTLETVREALDFEMAVIFIHLGQESNNIYLIEPSEDIHSMLGPQSQGTEEWEPVLLDWLQQLTVDPDQSLPETTNGSKASNQSVVETRGANLLQEYFDQPETPPRNADDSRYRGLRERCWSWFTKRFASAEKKSAKTPRPAGDLFRTRAAELSEHYSGLYRGTFFTNYLLAIATVTFATLGLILLGEEAHTDAGAELSSIVSSEDEDAVSLIEHPIWLLASLFILGALKLVCVVLITANTHQANSKEWNERSVDFRYLAERLRGVSYLNQVGSDRPPAATPTQFASRVARQSAVDWLFSAIARCRSPADIPSASRSTMQFDDGESEVIINKLIQIPAAEIVKHVRDHWIMGQCHYHSRNHALMDWMNRWMQSVSKVFEWSVIIVICLDLSLVASEYLGILKGTAAATINSATPWLILLSAVLPAVVAAIGGIRFQSECERLAERSSAMLTVLSGRGESAVPAGGRWKYADQLHHQIVTAQSNPDCDLGSWSHHALRMTERIATDFVEEVAEWSVLYAKEVSGP